jgi:transcriptional regulator with XRE-family HTH domain
LDRRRNVTAKRKKRTRDVDSRAFLSNREIGLKMMRLRDRLGLTTTELARKVGLSQAQISRLENGNQGFRSHTLMRIAAALGVKPIYFYMDQDDLSKVPLVRESEDLYGPGVPDELKEALRSPRFKRFASKSARVFLENEKAFARLSSLVRKTKI